MIGLGLFFAGFLTGAIAVVLATILLGRAFDKRTIRKQGRQLDVIDERLEAQLLEAMRTVAQRMHQVPESAIENGLAVSFGHEKPGYVVSVHRMGKKSFPELFLEASAQLKKLEEQP